MKRGKVIGAIVLLVAIGLIIAQMLGDSGVDITGSDSSVGVGSAAPGSPIQVPAGVPLPAAGEERVYAIDASQSEVYWRIYRAGAMAALGHNHVISIRDFDGSLTLRSDLAATDWNLSFSVADLIIDDPDLRARYGEEFESVPSEDDKAGTKTNMLTERVLNGDVYDEIVLTGRGANGSLATARLPVSIEMLGRTIEQVFPASLSINSDSVTVEGEYRLSHADLGMEPFSLFGGAIAVGEELDFTYRIHAVAGGQ